MGLSTHALETSTGQPAAGMGVSLANWHDDRWVETWTGHTDQDGRCKDLLPVGTELSPASYRLRFETGQFYTQRGERCLYPFVEIVFEVTDKRHYHVPLLIAANGYTTYRGS